MDYTTESQIKQVEYKESTTRLKPSAAKATATQMTNTSSSSFSMQAAKLTPVTLYHTRKMIDP